MAILDHLQPDLANPALQHPRAPPGASTGTDRALLKKFCPHQVTSITISQIHTNSCNYVDAHALSDYSITLH